MEIVLLEDVKALGKKGQVVKVSDGYARNFILPSCRRRMKSVWRRSSWRRLRNWAGNCQLQR